jgi:hypothetical protein
MPGLEAARVTALARRLELDEADERTAHGHRIVGPGLDVGHGSLADGHDGARRQTAQPGQRLQQVFERAVQLVFRLAGNDRVAQAGAGGLTEGGDRLREWRWVYGSPCDWRAEHSLGPARRISPGY